MCHSALLPPPGGPGEDHKTQKHTYACVVFHFSRVAAGVRFLANPGNRRSRGQKPSCLSPVWGGALAPPQEPPKTPVKHARIATWGAAVPDLAQIAVETRCLWTVLRGAPSLFHGPPKTPVNSVPFAGWGATVHRQAKRDVKPRCLSPVWGGALAPPHERTRPPRSLRKHR